jgi:hypothetical protein
MHSYTSKYASKSQLCIHAATAALDMSIYLTDWAAPFVLLEFFCIMHTSYTLIQVLAESV